MNLGTPGGIGTRFMMFPLVWNAQKKNFFLSPLKFNPGGNPVQANSAYNANSAYQLYFAYQTSQKRSSASF